MGDTKKEIIEEMISEDEKKFFSMSYYYQFCFLFTFSSRIYSFFFNFYFFLIPASRICCTFVLSFFFSFYFSFFLFFCFRVSLCVFRIFVHTYLRRSSPDDVELKQTQGISLIF